MTVLLTLMIKTIGDKLLLTRDWLESFSCHIFLFKSWQNANQFFGGKIQILPNSGFFYTLFTCNSITISKEVFALKSLFVISYLSLFQILHFSNIKRSHFFTTWCQILDHRQMVNFLDILSVSKSLWTPKVWRKIIVKLIAQTSAHALLISIWVLLGMLSLPGTILPCKNLFSPRNYTSQKRSVNWKICNSLSWPRNYTSQNGTVD